MGSRLSLLTSTCKLFPIYSLHINQCIYASSLSVQVITRGANPAGYGFVSLRTEEAVHKAVQTLNKKELDGRQVIVEVAKPADQKDRRERRFFRRRTGRRGGKAVPGEVTEAEANGEAPKTEAAVSGTDEAVKPKKKKKKTAVSHFCACFCWIIAQCTSARPRPGLRLLRRLNPVLMQRARRLLPSLPLRPLLLKVIVGSSGVIVVLWVKIPSVILLKICSLSPILVSILRTKAF